jgi:RNA polymerase sigma factor (sigma-70 family)
LDDPYDSQSSSPVTPLDLRRYRAERLLRKDFAGLRAKVLTIVRSQLRGKHIKLDPADLEACYAQAWHGLYATLLEGGAVESPSAWLVLVTYRRAIDEHRSNGRVGLVDGEERGSYIRASHASAQDLAAELDDRARLRQVFEGLRSHLTAREREAASLCYLQGLSRAEAAERMGISEARMRKLMEGTNAGRPGVAGKMGDLLDTIKAGGWCEQQSSLMKAYAFGILDTEGERHALAVAHCRECPACRAHVASLRGLASVLPLPLLPRLTLAGGSVTAAGAGRSGGSAAGGWSGLSGSLTAKLAVTAVVMLGSGYAVLSSRAHSSRAHGSPAGPSPPLAPSPAPAPVALGGLSHALFALPHARARARVGQPMRRHTAPRRRPVSSARGATPTIGAPASEFGPERASAVGSVSPSAPRVASLPAPSAGSATGEFGLE